MLSNRKRLMYTPQQDIILLMEVLDKNPYRNKGAWHDIVLFMRSKPGFLGVETKSLRDRVNLLLSKFRNNELHTLMKLGNDEEYSEREQLLQEVSDMEEKGTNEQWTRKRSLEMERSDSKRARIDSSREDSFQSDMPKQSPSSSGQLSPDPSSNAMPLPITFSYPDTHLSSSSQSQPHVLSPEQVRLREMELEVKKMELLHREQERIHRQRMEMERLEMEKTERTQLHELLQLEKEERSKSQEEERNLRRDLHALVQQQIKMMRVMVEMLEKN